MTDGMSPSSAIGLARPSVDVVIPIRNRARFIGQCLDSLRAQTLQPDGVIVVDDGSTDDTAEILADYARAWPALRVVPTPPRGVASARNTAISLSTAQLIGFIDSDDIWDPTMLARQVALFTPDRPRLALVHCGFRPIDKRGDPIADAPIALPHKRGDIFRDILEAFYAIAPSTIVARRDVILSVGGFDESIFMAEDRDFCLKIAKAWDIDFVPDALVQFRIHADSTYERARKHDPEGVLFQRLRVWDKWFDEIDDLDAVLRRFRDDALSAGVAMMLRPRPDFSLYRQLAGSNLRLATTLFPDRATYVRALLRPIVRSRSLTPFDLYRKCKLALATQIILPNRRLLRIAQKFGHFKGIEPPR